MPLKNGIYLPLISLWNSDVVMKLPTVFEHQTARNMGTAKSNEPDASSTNTITEYVNLVWPLIMHAAPTMIGSDEISLC